MTELEPRIPLRLAALARWRGREIAARVSELGRSGCRLRVDGDPAAGLVAGEEVVLLLSPVGRGELPVPGHVTSAVPVAAEGAGRASEIELELDLEATSEEVRAGLAEILAGAAPEILAVGFGSSSRASLARLLGEGARMRVAADEAEALELLAEGPVAVLCLGEKLAGEDARAFLRRVREQQPSGDAVVLVLAAGPRPEVFQDLIDEDAIFYLTQEPVFDFDLLAILRSALDRWWLTRRAGSADGSERDEVAHRVHQVLAAARRVAIQRDVASAGELAVEAIEEILAAERAYYLIYDAGEELLWAGEPGASDERQESAAVGLVSFVARTGRPVLRDRVAADPRYEKEADDPRGGGDERFAAAPVRGPDRKVLAVLVAVRAPGRPPFAEEDLAILQLLGDQVASTFSQLALEARLESAVNRRGEELREQGFRLFREEAVAAYADGVADRGDLLRISPRWASWSYWLLVALVASGVLFASAGTLREYATGPAVVRVPGLQDITATAAGTVTAIEVRVGQRVAPGDLLVRFYGAAELAELERIESELELQLANRLRNPADAAARQALISLRAQRELARARLDERSVRASTAGVVRDLRVRPGQHVQPGQSLLSLAGEGGEPKIVALLPGSYRPQIHPGMSLRLELQGYRYGYQYLTIGTVGEEVVGPAEARRFLGEEIGDAITVQGPVVLVEAPLPASTFEVDGHSYVYHDGMYAVAEVAVRSESIAVALFPALKNLRRSEGG